MNRNRARTLYLVSLATIALLSTAHGAVIHVPADQPTIQAGIDVAAAADTVLVEAGVYQENLDFLGKGIVVASRFLGTDDPFFIEQTVIDGGAAGSVVRFENGEDSNAVLIGFTLSNGNADYGGGVRCTHSSPKLLDLIVTGNEAVSGGGIYCADHADPTLERLTVRDNHASISGTGGGVRCTGYSSPRLQDLRIEDNTALHGGGFSCYFYCNPVLRNVSITGNTATSTLPSSPSGGGLNCGGFSKPILERVQITGNMAGSFSNLSGRGGGIACSGGSEPVLAEVTVSDNTASFVGGGIFCEASAGPILVNGIVWNNSPEEIYFGEHFDPNMITVAYSDLQGGQGGIIKNGNGTVSWLDGNINLDPLFLDSGGGNYHLTEGSPCIDAGTAFFVVDGDTLVDIPPGQYFGDAPEMGAYEFLSALDVEDRVVAAESRILRPSRPNPILSTGTLTYALRSESFVSLRVLDVTGRQVGVLASGWQEAGSHQVEIDGSTLDAGIYFLSLEARTLAGELVRDCGKLLVVR